MSDTPEPAPIPREDLCPLTWCIARKGHEGDCTTVPRQALPPTDFGPKAAVSTRRGT